MGAATGEIAGRKLRDTESVCPVCLKKIPAEIVSYGDCVYMEKQCVEHGEFQTLIWRGKPDYEDWKNEKIPAVPVRPAKEVNRGCPYDCGLCPDHRQHTCCVLLEVTNRCNLKCPVCFARAGEQKEAEEPSMEEIGAWYDAMMDCGGPFNIQLSGGEPTMRRELPEIIRLGRKKGFTFFQLNTNGIRLASEGGYARELKEAGLNCVFLQFDGLKEETYRRLRGRELLELKKKAIANCKSAGLGVVLVPTVAKGINDDEVGAVLKFAWEQMPAVRGVHFQPMSFFGRYEAGSEKERFTLPELLGAIEAQTDGIMRTEDFRPAGAENAYCSFSGNFMLTEEGLMRPWHDSQGCGCGAPADDIPDAGEAAGRARRFVAKRWAASRTADESGCCCCEENKPAPYDVSSLDRFLKRVDTYSLAVSAMAFMDVWNLDLERLRDCYIHVVTGGKKVRLIPFCAYNMTSTEGKSLYRGMEE